MRQKLAFAVIALLALIISYKHLLVLGEVALTYTAIHFKAVQRYDFPTANQPEEADQPKIVPKIIHQIYLDERNTNAPSRVGDFSSARQSCVDLHPDWKFNLWTSDNATDFVKYHYPHLASTYTSYAQPIQRANILRYLLIHHYGGIYLDLDLVCRVSLDPLLHLSWLTPGAHPVGINNAFILARPKHTFLGYALIPSIERHNLKWGLPYVENMFSTGCMFFSSMFMLYSTSDMRVLGNGKQHFLRGHVVTPLFEHLGESSWHNWDAAVFMWISGHFLLLGVALTLTIILLGVLVSKIATRRRVRHRRQMEQRWKARSLA